MYIIWPDEMGAFMIYDSMAETDTPSFAQGVCRAFNSRYRNNCKKGGFLIGVS